MLEPNFDRIPAELRNKDAWVVWRLEATKKAPFDPSTGKRVDITGPRVGTSFQQATEAWESRRYAGIGFVLKGKGIAGVDLDHCVTDGRIDDRARSLLCQIGCKYVELSPSGKGLRGFGLIPEGLHAPAAVGEIDGISVELYTCKRYLTVTGHVVEELSDADEPIQVMVGFSEVAGLLKVKRFTQENQDTKEKHDTQETQAGGDPREISRGFVVTPYPSRCIPKAVGQRHRALFELARWLKAIMPDAKREQLKVAVYQWHRQHLDVIGTKEFAITWSDFLNAWNAVEKPYGAKIDALLKDLPPLEDWMKGQDFGELGERLLRMCLALSAYFQPEPFFLDCRTAGDRLGISHTSAASLLKSLVRDGYLVLVKKGHTGKASEYRIGSSAEPARDLDIDDPLSGDPGA